MQACEACFIKTLRYESPAHGGWGLVKLATQLPESHLLFFSPPACGRHGALSSVVSGIKEQVSYVCFTEKEIVEGTYIESFLPAVDDLLAFLSKRPRAILIYTSCIDDLLGTDRQALRRAMEEKHPDIKFRFCQMDPIQLDSSKKVPGISLFVHMYDLLDGARTNPQPRRVDLLGNVLAMTPENEIVEVLHEAGVGTISQLPEMTTFDQFLEMANASLALVVHPRALEGAKHLEAVCGVPYLPAFCTYDLKEIDAFYEKLSDRLSAALGHKVVLDLAERRTRAKEAWETARKMLEGKKVAIDFQAVAKPYTLARTMLQLGFNVTLVATDGVSDMDKPSFEWIRERFPRVEIANPLDPEGPKYRYRATDSDDVCVGFDVGDMVGSGHVAPILEDDDHFGYQGIERFCKKLMDAAAIKSNLHTMIKEANLVV